MQKSIWGTNVIIKSRGFVPSQIISCDLSGSMIEDAIPIHGQQDERRGRLFKNTKDFNLIRLPPLLYRLLYRPDGRRVPRLRRRVRIVTKAPTWAKTNVGQGGSPLFFVPTTQINSASAAAMYSLASASVISVE